MRHELMDDHNRVDCAQLILRDVHPSVIVIDEKRLYTCPLNASEKCASENVRRWSRRSWSTNKRLVWSCPTSLLRSIYEAFITSKSFQAMKQSLQRDTSNSCARFPKSSLAIGPSCMTNTVSWQRPICETMQSQGFKYERSYVYGGCKYEHLPLFHREYRTFSLRLPRLHQNAPLQNESDAWKITATR